MAFYEHWVEDFAVPSAGLNLGQWIGAVIMGKLNWLPRGDDAATYQMAPSNSCLVNGELTVHEGVVFKFGMRWAAVHYAKSKSKVLMKVNVYI